MLRFVAVRRCSWQPRLKPAFHASKSSSKAFAGYYAPGRLGRWLTPISSSSSSSSSYFLARSLATRATGTKTSTQKAGTKRASKKKATTTTKTKKKSTDSTATSTAKARKAGSDKAKLLKEKEKAQKAKVKERLAKERERAKAKKEKEKEKEKAQRAKERSKMLAAKEKAAKPKTRSTLPRPPKAPGNTWTVFREDFIKDHAASLAPGDPKPTTPEYSKLAADAYKQLGPSEKADLVARVEERKKTYPEEYTAWLKTLTPEMVREENLLRLRRKKQGLSKKRPLRLEGEPKRAFTPYLFFGQDVRSGEVATDVDGHSILDGETNVLKQATLIAAAWRKLSPSQKEKYELLAKEDKERYAREKAKFLEELEAQKSEA